jgi:hypothetical protein
LSRIKICYERFIKENNYTEITKYEKANIYTEYEDLDGYKYRTKPSYIYSGRRPFAFHEKNPYLIDNAHNFIRLNNLSCILLSKECGNENTVLSFKCKCGNTYKTSLGNFKLSKREQCDICWQKSRGESRKNNVEDVYKMTSEIGYYFNKEDFVKMKVKINMIDNNRYKYFYAPVGIQQGKKPYIFHRSNPYTIDNIKNYIKINNLDVELVDDKYISDNYYMTWKCNCGETFKNSWDKFKQRKRIYCDNCNNAISSYERKTIELLDKLNIKYKKEYQIDNPLHRNGNHKLRYDFYLKDYNAMIEVDGHFHFKKTFSKYRNGEEIFKKRQLYDQIKNQYCIDNNIPLLRIPYWEFDKNDNYKKLIIDFINKNSDLNLYR